MADISGIACVIHARREIVSCVSVAGGYKLHLLLRKMGCLLKSYNVVFLTLVLVYVICAVAVAQLYSRAVWEQKHAFSRLVFSKTRKLTEKRYDMVFTQLGERASHEQLIEPRILKCEHYELSPHSPALSASARTAVGNMPCTRFKKEELLFVRHSR